MQVIDADSCLSVLCSTDPLCCARRGWGWTAAMLGVKKEREGEERDDVRHATSSRRFLFSAFCGEGTNTRKWESREVRVKGHVNYNPCFILIMVFYSNNIYFIPR